MRARSFAVGAFVAIVIVAAWSLRACASTGVTSAPSAPAGATAGPDTPRPRAARAARTPDDPKAASPDALPPVPSQTPAQHGSASETIDVLVLDATGAPVAGALIEVGTGLTVSTFRGTASPVRGRAPKR